MFPTSLFLNASLHKREQTRHTGAYKSRLRNIARSKCNRFVIRSRQTSTKCASWKRASAKSRVYRSNYSSTMHGKITSARWVVTSCLRENGMRARDPSEKKNAIVSFRETRPWRVSPKPRECGRFRDRSEWPTPTDRLWRNSCAWCPMSFGEESTRKKFRKNYLTHALQSQQWSCITLKRVVYKIINWKKNLSRKLTWGRNK